MKTSTHRTANKIMLAMSLVLFISSGLILGVKALTIGTATINTMQVIKRIIISNTNSTSSADVLIDINNDAAGTVYIKNKLGIGDSTPSAALHVSGSIIADEYCDSDGTTCSTVANMIGGGITGFVETDPIYNTGANGKLCMQVNEKIVCETATSSGFVDTDTHLTTGQVDAMVADNGYLTSVEAGLWNTGVDSINYMGGNVGIGTGTPSKTLTVSGTASINALYTNTIQTKNEDDESSLYLFSASSSTSGAYIAMFGRDFYDDRAGDMRLFYGGYTNTGEFSITHIDGKGLLSASTKYFTILSSGDVGIGVSDPSEKLEVNGNVLADAFLYPSDITLKTNIVAIDNALDKIREINAYTFDRIENGESSIGFIAQELEKTYPDMVHTNNDGIKSVNYVNMVIPLTQAVKELDAENQKLKAEIAEIKAMLIK